MTPHPTPGVGRCRIWQSGRHRLNASRHTRRDARASHAPALFPRVQSPRNLRAACGLLTLFLVHPAHHRFSPPAQRPGQERRRQLIRGTAAKRGDRGRRDAKQRRQAEGVQDGVVRIAEIARVGQIVVGGWQLRLWRFRGLGLKIRFSTMRLPAVQWPKLLGVDAGRPFRTRNGCLEGGPSLG